MKYKLTTKEYITWIKKDIKRLYYIICYFTKALFNVDKNILLSKDFKVDSYIITFHSDDYNGACYDERRFDNFKDAYELYELSKNQECREDFVRLHISIEYIGNIEIARYK
jgi:hypothetical protein